MVTTDPVAVALRMARCLESLGIPYVIGGSLASSIHGEPRSTVDVDFAVRLQASEVDGLLSELADAFHVTREGVVRAVAGSTSFNALHRSYLETWAGRLGLSAALERAFDEART